MFTNYGRSYAQNYGPSYGANYGGSYGRGYGQGYGQGYGRSFGSASYRDYASSRFGGYGNWGGQNGSYYQMGQNKRFAVDQNYAQMEMMKQQNALMQKLLQEREKAVDKTNESFFSLNKVGNYIKGFWRKIGENPQISRTIKNAAITALNSKVPFLGTATNMAGSYLADHFNEDKTLQVLFKDDPEADDPAKNPYLAGYNTLSAAYEKGRNYMREQQMKAAQEKMQESQQQNFSFIPQSFNYGAPSPGSNQSYGRRNFKHSKYQPPLKNTYFSQLPQQQQQKYEVQDEEMRPLLMSGEHSRKPGFKKKINLGNRKNKNGIRVENINAWDWIDE